jgi:butyryl-CoA dehydrogenase
VGALTLELARRGLAGDPEAMLLHSSDYLDLFSTVVVAWMWMLQAAAAREGLAAGRGASDLLQGKLCAAGYWLGFELPRVGPLVAACRDGEDSYARTRPEWF